MFKTVFVRAPALFLSLALVLAVSVPVPAYAGQATSSDADPVDDSFGGFGIDGFSVYTADDGIMPLADSAVVTKISNTVSFPGSYMYLAYNNTRGGVTFLPVQLGSDGYFNFNRPADYVSAIGFQLNLHSRSLPVTGNYACAWNFIMNTGVSYPFAVSRANIWSRFTSKNASRVEKSSFIIDTNNLDHKLEQNYGQSILYRIYGKNGSLLEFSNFGDFYGYIPSVGFINTSDTIFGIVVNVDSDSLSFPCNGYVRVSFTRTGSQPVITTPGSPPSSTDISQNISEGVSGIASSVTELVDGISDVAEAIADLPQNIVAGFEPHYNNILQQLHHITEQLHAFWDQLAAYFNDHLIPQMVEDTDRIVEAIENIDLEVNVSMTELINTINKNHQEQLANDDKNHQAQLANDDKNTDTIVNGYDGQSFKEANEELSGVLDAYDKAEDDLFDSVSGNVQDFEYEDPFDKFTEPLYDISYILHMLYSNIGRFNVGIAFNFTLSIALLCIGWYRFKGGT